MKKSFPSNRLNKIVAFVSPPSRSFNHYHPPLALMYLAGYLGKFGYDSEIIDIFIKEQVRDENFLKNRQKFLAQIKNDTIKKIRKLKPDIIGITCYTPEYDEVCMLAKEIKKWNKEVKIIVGGVHPTFFPEDFIKLKSNFDIAVIGEGELTMLDIVQTLRNNRSLSNIDGIAYYKHDLKQIKTTNKRNLCQDLDSISFPAYHKINMEYYTTASPYSVRGVFLRSMYLLYSRGCPSQCTFCVAKRLRTCNGIGKYIRLRSPEKVFAEIKNLRDKYSIDSFYFIDDLFTLDKNKVKEFCNLLIKSDYNVLWACSSKVTTVDYDTLKKMKEAGCLQIDFGVERGSDAALAFVKKGITVAIIRKVFSDCRKLGIRTFANMLVNIPGETEQDLDDILNLIKEIQPTIVGINIFTPYPGTEIFDEYKSRFSKKDYPLLIEDPGILTNRFPKKFRFATHHVNFHEWASDNTRKFNKLLPNLKVYFTSRYLSTIINSKNKSDYLREFKNLFRELINQKFHINKTKSQNNY